MDNTNHSVKKEVIQLPEEWKDKLAFVLHNVYTPEECDEFIKKTEKMGYEQALLNVGGGRQILRMDVRNNSRCIWDSHEEADRMWMRIKKYVPNIWRNRDALGLNERFRFLKYDPGEYFKPHLDGSYRRENGEISFITVMLYLNQGYDGGNTTFLSWGERERAEVVPKTGSMLIFEHEIFHEGGLLVDGRKYAIRTDVMYSASPILKT